MTAPHIIDPAGMLGEALSQAFSDLMRSLLQHVINALLSADADTVCGVQWCQQEPQRRPGAIGIATGPRPQGAELLTWRSPSCAKHLPPRMVAVTPQTLRQCPTRGVESPKSKGHLPQGAPRLHRSVRAQYAVEREASVWDHWYNTSRPTLPTETIASSPTLAHQTSQRSSTDRRSQRRNHPPSSARR